MKFRLICFSLTALLFIACPVFATSPASAFQKQKIIDVNFITVPTVMEVPFGSELNNSNLLAVYNETRGLFEPYYFKKSQVSNPINVTAILLAGYDSETYKIVDNNSKTYKEFLVSGEKIEKTTIVLQFTAPISSNSLSLLLDQYVALPNLIEIRASLYGNEKVILASQKMTSNNIYFPVTNADKWLITFTYGQPLRIVEITLQQNDKISNQGLRFLAQPNNKYVIYFNPDRYINIPVAESGNLSSNDGVIIVPDIDSQNNSSYVLADTDSDSVPDIRDNCVNIDNFDQVDVNGNGRGDACDDFDKDAILNINDNCPNAPNRDQIDSDHDGLGDVCDTEESRLTEKYKFIPWLGIGLALITIIILFAITYKKKIQ